MEKNLYDLVTEVRDLMKQAMVFLGWILIVVLFIACLRIAGC